MIIKVVNLLNPSYFVLLCPGLLILGRASVPVKKSLHIWSTGVCGESGQTSQSGGKREWQPTEKG